MIIHFIRMFAILSIPFFCIACTQTKTSGSLDETLDELAVDLSGIHDAINDINNNEVINITAEINHHNQTDDELNNIHKLNNSDEEGEYIPYKYNHLKAMLGSSGGTMKKYSQFTFDNNKKYPFGDSEKIINLLAANNNKYVTISATELAGMISYRNNNIDNPPINYLIASTNNPQEYRILKALQDSNNEKDDIIINNLEFKNNIEEYKNTRKGVYEILINEVKKVKEKYNDNPYVEVTGFSVDTSIPPSININFYFLK
jgi:hypothetical protein